MDVPTKELKFHILSTEETIAKLEKKLEAVVKARHNVE
jgi:hypothetical protein